MQKILSQV